MKEAYCPPKQCATHTGSTAAAERALTAATALPDRRSTDGPTAPASAQAAYACLKRDNSRTSAVRRGDRNDDQCAARLTRCGSVRALTYGRARGRHDPVPQLRVDAVAAAAL